MEVEASAAFNYIVTAHRPTAVVKSVAVLDVPLYGRVSSLLVFRPKGSACDLLFVLLERYRFCILQFDTASSGCWLGGVGRGGRRASGGSGCGGGRWASTGSEILLGG
ncbi:hypothetical protein V8C86DRAFT_3091735 [Haematococcus lacustris]